MSDILTKPTPQTDADYEAIAQELLAEMNRLEEQMDSDRTESERLRFETQIIKATIEAKLARLDEQVNNLLKAN